MRKEKESSVKNSLDDGGESTLACPMLIFRELVDPDQQWLYLEEGARRKWKQDSLVFPLRLPPPGALDGQGGQGQEKLEGEVLWLDEPMVALFHKNELLSWETAGRDSCLGIEHGITVKYNAHSQVFTSISVAQDPP